MKWYWHPEQNSCRFFNDPAHPELVDRRTASTGGRRTRDPASSSSSPTSCTRTREQGTASRTRSTGRSGTSYGFWTDERAPRSSAGTSKDGTRLVPATRAGREPVHADDRSGRRPSLDAIVRARGIDRRSATPSTPIRRVLGFKKLFQRRRHQGRALRDSSRATAGPGRPPIRGGRSATRSSARSTCSVSAAVRAPSTSRAPPRSRRSRARPRSARRLILMGESGSVKSWRARSPRPARRLSRRARRGRRRGRAR